MINHGKGQNLPKNNADYRDGKDTPPEIKVNGSLMSDIENCIHNKGPTGSKVGG